MRKKTREKRTIEIKNCDSSKLVELQNFLKRTLRITNLLVILIKLCKQIYSSLINYLHYKIYDFKMAK